MEAGLKIASVLLVVGLCASVVMILIPNSSFAGVGTLGSELTMSIIRQPLIGVISDGVSASSDGSWSIETVDNQPDDRVYAGGNTSIALDSSNYPHISYHDPINDALNYARWDGSSWQIENVDSGGVVGYFTSIALDSNGCPHISYNDYTNGDLKYAYFDGDSWQIETVDNTGLVGYDTSIALDSNGRPHISYSGSGYYQYLKYARWTGDNWTIEIIDSNSSNTSLALDSNDRPHISYEFYSGGRFTKTLKYAHWDGSSWQIENVVSGNESVLNTSIALDSNDSPHMIYNDGGDLKYVQRDGEAWQTETVISNVSGGSMALDSNDCPHISYCAGVLKYARWSGVAWQIETVDNTWSFGGFDISIALDSNDNPHISYYEDANNDLKYARWTMKGEEPSPEEEPSPVWHLIGGIIAVLAVIGGAVLYRRKGRE